MPNQQNAADKLDTKIVTLRTALVLGGTGRTGALVARKLGERGLNARTASRRGADVRFDWDDPMTYAPALDRADRVYLVTPVTRTKFTRQIAEFLDLAALAGVRHVTYLSTYGGDRAHREARSNSTSRRGSFSQPFHSDVVMQNFSDEHLPLVGGAITVPTGGRKEAFVDAADIAAVAVETLVKPDAHGGTQYAPTGAQSLTVGEVADIIASLIDRPVVHNDFDPDAWINGAVEAVFLPADYAIMLRWLTGTIIAGNGSRPHDHLEKVTGRPATNFGDFTPQNAAAWAF